MNENYSNHLRIGAFRYGIIGHLLQAPVDRGSLISALKELSEKQWIHPISGKKVSYHWTTIERWYYRSRKKGVVAYSELGRKPREERGTYKSVHSALEAAITELYAQHANWSITLLVDELRAKARKNPELEPVPSYSTIKRYLNSHGMRRRIRIRDCSSGQYKAQLRVENREIRSYEYPDVGGLWHLDFHHGTRRIVDKDGQLKVPIALGIMDDASRFICHMQWYFSENTECLVHGYIQAIQKLGVPAKLMTDNGSAMTSEEFMQGVLRIGTQQETTLIYSPYQNGKQERFWGSVEGRLMAMLEGVKELTLDKLNEFTLIWLNQEYHCAEHKELEGKSPLEKYQSGPDVHKPYLLELMHLKAAFTKACKRRQRRSDGTISLESKRFEVPDQYRFLKDIPVRYARWDLSKVHIYDRDTDKLICRIYPLDKLANASGHRRSRVNPLAITAPEANTDAPATLLQEMIENFQRSGLPPAYIPFIEAKDNAE